MGQNPTGGTLSIKRRKEIYAVCQKYDVLIIEDDPYWNLQYPSVHDLVAQYRDASPQHHPHRHNAIASPSGEWKSSGYAFLDSLIPSYLSIDIEGRVIRLDTFSKTIAPGCRLGWMTAQPTFIERITRITEVSTQQPSGFVQALVAKLFLGQQMEEHPRAARCWSKDNKNKGQKPEVTWQMDGWVRWLEGLRGAYEHRMQDMCVVLEQGKFLVEANNNNHKNDWELITKTQIFDFSFPTAGMFVWLKIYLETHPLYKADKNKYPLSRLSKALWMHLTHKPHQVLVTPGEIFAPTPEIRDDRAWQYHRLSFAPMTAEDVVDCSRRAVEGYRSFWQRGDLNGLEGYDVEEMRMEVMSLGC